VGHRLGTRLADRDGREARTPHRQGRARRRAQAARRPRRCSGPTR
jgi:hypothetical protein